MASGEELLNHQNILYDKTIQFLLYFIKIFSITLIVFLAKVIKTEYEIWGILLILFIHAFYPFKNKINIFGKKLNVKPLINKTLFLLGFTAFAVVKYMEYWNKLSLNNIMLYTIFTILPAFLVLLNNGKKGPSLKYVFYIYYPLQFIILGMLLGS